MPKRIAILGSTGSIGCSALEAIAGLGAEYVVTVLAAGKNAKKLLEQARICRPAAVAIADDAIDPDLLAEFKALGIAVHRGNQSLAEVATRDDVDIVLAAVVGAAGLPAVLAAVRAGKTLALANKESLVVAGALLMAEAKARGVRVLPVDSEHSAIFQAMAAGRQADIARVILTASGGPFRTWPRQRIETASYEDALRHPTWRMGGKITIDSATLFNKALEIIEARWLFDLPAEKIQVVVHPESVVHSMVEFIDGSVIAQLSPPGHENADSVRLDLSPSSARRGPADGLVRTVLAAFRTAGPGAFPGPTPGVRSGAGRRHDGRGAQRRQRGGRDGVRVR